MGSVRLLGGVDASMQVRSAARRIERYSGEYRFSLEELEKLESDLSHAEGMLLNGLYRGAGTPAPRVPDRTEELFSDVGFYWSAGQVWRDSLTALGVSRSGRVAEIGCGVVPKVGGGLHYFEFGGTLDLVDVSEDALQRASRWLTLLGVRFSHNQVRSRLFDLDPESYDGIFANHIIDDLLLYEYCVRAECPLNLLYLDGSQYVEAWRRISRNPDWIPSFVEELVTKVTAALAPGGALVMTDYQSHSHSDLGLNGITRQVHEVQRRIRKGLLNLGLRPLDAHLPPCVRCERFELRTGDVIAFQKEVAS